VGSLVGAVGSVFKLSNAAQAGIQLVAAIFMVLMALNLLDIGGLRSVVPTLPVKLRSKLMGKSDLGRLPSLIFYIYYIIIFYIFPINDNFIQTMKRWKLSIHFHLRGLFSCRFMLVLTPFAQDRSINQPAKGRSSDADSIVRCWFAAVTS